MGLILSKTISYYGFNGVLLDANDQSLIGFIKSTGENVYFDGLASTLAANPINVNQKMVTAGEYITGFVINGPVDSMSRGTIQVIDSANASFVVSAEVKCPANSTVPYIMEYKQSDANSIVGEMAIGTDDSGSTVFDQLAAVDKPMIKTFPINGAGAIGFVEHESQGLVGLIEDGGNWKMFAENISSNSSNLHAKYFDTGFVLSGIQVMRKVSNHHHHHHHHHQRGESAILFQTINTSNIKRDFHSWQLLVLSLTNSFSYNSGTGNVIHSFQYLTTPGMSSERMDFLIQSGTSMVFQVPDVNGYTPKLPIADHKSTELPQIVLQNRSVELLRDELHDTKQDNQNILTIIFIGAFTILVIALGYALYVYFWKHRYSKKMMKSTKAENNNESEEVEVE